MKNNLKALLEVDEELASAERGTIIEEVRRAKQPSEAILELLATMDIPGYPEPDPENPTPNDGLPQAALFRRAFRVNRGPIAVAYHHIEVLEDVYGMPRHTSAFAAVMSAAVYLGMHEQRETIRMMAKLFLNVAEALDTIGDQQHKDTIGRELGCRSVLTHQWEVFMKMTADEVNQRLAGLMTETDGRRHDITNGMIDEMSRVGRSGYEPDGVRDPD